MAFKTVFLPIAVFNLLCSSAYAEGVETLTPKSIEACSGIENSATRLACYDQYFRPESNVQTSLKEIDVKEQAGEEVSLTDKMKNSLDFIYSGEAGKISPSVSLLDSRWELSEMSKLGTWNLRGYKPIYVFPAFWTSKKNEYPQSPNPHNTVTDRQDLNSTDFKFQLSLKTKAVENVFGNNGDVWLGYTQSSRWQILNATESRPFRETNYEPEASIIFRTNYKVLGLDGRLLGLTMNHQSNGRADPFSRSWNRLMLNVGLERDNFAIMLRPWYRIPEKRAEDNNPDIVDYMGRADLTAFYKWHDHNFSMMLRHSLRTGEASHGAVQLDWSFPIHGKLRGQLQYFNGYGESLIDYNHRANYVGLGVSLMDWF